MITVTGQEIILQKILVMEEDYFVFRGRMSGSQDGGLVVIMPFDQISNVCFNKRMLEPEVCEIFGNANGFMTATVTAAGDAGTPTPAPASPAEAKPAAADTSSALEDTIADINNKPALPTPAAEEPGPSESLLKPKQISKTTLLARFDARLAGQTKA